MRVGPDEERWWQSHLYRARLPYPCCRAAPITPASYVRHTVHANAKTLQCCHGATPGHAGAQGS